jgi:hypothetical protein
MATVQRPRTEASMTDLLFKEMREFKPITVIRTDIFSGETYEDNSRNKYDYEADTYTNRIVFGNFSKPRIKTKAKKPLFRLGLRDLSDELKENLAERAKLSKESVHRVVQAAVYELIRARQPHPTNDLRSSHDSEIGHKKHGHSVNGF